MFKPQPLQLFVGALVISWCIKCRDFFTVNGDARKKNCSEL